MAAPLTAAAAANNSINSTQAADTSHVTVGIEQFWFDFLDNFRGNFNSLLLVPVFILASWWYSSEIMGTRPCLRWFLNKLTHHRRPMSFSQRSNSVEVIDQTIMDQTRVPWICGPHTMMRMFSGTDVENKTIAELSSKYSHVGLVAAYLLTLVSSKLTWIQSQDYPLLDKHVYGILWCSATYAFFCSTVSSVMIIFAYGQCRNDSEARYWTHHMGGFALRLPMLSAGLGFVIYILGTTHFYIMVFRRGKGDDFAACAAFCYAALPITVFALLKVHHGLAFAQKREEAVRALAPLEYEDIDALFEDYMEFEHKTGHSHLDSDLDDFLNFVSGRKIVRDGVERGGHLRGLRRAYAHTLLTTFHDLEMKSQGPIAEDGAKRIFAKLSKTNSKRDRMGFNTLQGVDPFAVKDSTEGTAETAQPETSENGIICMSV